MVALALLVVLALLIASVAILVLNVGDQNGDSSGDVTMNTAEDGVEATIILGTSITVDGKAISTDQSSALYMCENDAGYSMINIVEAGTYTINGSAVNVQIYVNADDDDEVVLVLNGTEISCDSAPAILINNAYDPRTQGESGVTIHLATGTSNVVNGSHTEENDAAISSNISLLIEGDGALHVNADNEGIETCMHLMINDGNITITSDEDAINANEDGISHIVINGGTVYADSSSGSDGDGIDSNGYLIINGGTVYGFASGQNCGMDSDLGTIINGGTVFATGTMNDGISSSSGQTCIDFSLPSTLGTDTLVYITDQSGDPIAAFKTLARYSTFIFSSSELSDSDTYKVYVGGAVNGSFDVYGLCTSFTITSSGTLQSNSTPGMI